jgi:hypothetical protein
MNLNCRFADLVVLEHMTGRENRHENQGREKGGQRRSVLDTRGVRVMWRIRKSETVLVRIGEQGTRTDGTGLRPTDQTVGGSSPSERAERSMRACWAPPVLWRPLVWVGSSDSEWRLKPGEHGKVANAKGRKFASLNRCRGGHQIIAKSDRRVRTSVRTHEFGCLPGDAFAHRKDAHRGEQATNFTSFLGAHAPGDLGNADHTRGEPAFVSPCRNEPFSGNRVSAEMCDQDIRVNQNHADESSRDVGTVRQSRASESLPRQKESRRTPQSRPGPTQDRRCRRLVPDQSGYG